MALDRYQEKRHFAKTPEPEGTVEKSQTGKLYIIQKHAARRLHYDLRLELDGVLKSWAVPKGPSMVPGEKRLAVHVEDHPVEYGSFEGIIPEGEYGGGTVMLWDRGTWEPIGDPLKGYEKGDFKFRLNGEKLKGSWVLARMKGSAGENGKNWLLIKKHDEDAISGSDPEPVDTMNRSVASGRTMEEIAEQRKTFWYEGESVPEAEVPTKVAEPSSKKHTKKAFAASDPSKLPGAREAPLPEDLRPELATLVSDPPKGDNWIHEIKYDGYRILCVLSNGRSRLISRNGKEWTDRFPEIAETVSALPPDNVILDGEVVVVDNEGRTDFQALQNILRGLQTGRLVYFAFDVPYCKGYDLTKTPLLERKAFLQQMLEALPDGSRIVYADHIKGEGSVVYHNACRFALEGIVSKRADSSYESRRSRSWLKVKCGERQEFVIGGFTDPGGSRKGFGALLVGYYDPEGKLVYSGRVGTGFNEKILNDLYGRLDAIRAGKSPFVNPPTGYEASGVHYVKPELVCEVEFTAWTDEGILRHPSFKGLREDKSPTEIVREKPPVEAAESVPAKSGEPIREAAQPPAVSESRSRPGPTRIAVSNPDRILYPEMGVTKLALAEYYRDIADWILPHLVRRPLTLVRCPEGREKECFYQKHLGDNAPKVLRAIPIMEKDGQEYYSVLDEIEGVIALVQIGTLEIHVWGCREEDIEHPDMMVFDLDPAPDVTWERMIVAAYLLRGRLLDLGLTSFLKTTGGKGLHVVVPLVPRADWDTVKEFSKAVADGIVREFPRDYIATMSKEKRKGKIFIDYLRNGRGATSICAYSSRARQNAPVSTPVEWSELQDIRADSFNIENIRRRLSNLKKDPWAGYFEVKQSLTEEMRKQAV